MNLNVVDHDDKYSKFAQSKPAVMPGLLKLTHSKLGKLGLSNVPTHIFSYLCFVIATLFAFTYVIGVHFNLDNMIWFGALQLEILGLVLVRAKIKTRGSVSGLSGMTFIMYAMVYFSRVALHITNSWHGHFSSHDAWFKFFNPNFQISDLDFDATLGVCSFVLVLDIIVSIFVTHRKTYDADIDKLKAWHVVAACCTMALVVRPHFKSWNAIFGYCWGATMYMDMLALMPQVCMMAMSSNKVETPIADFVFLTSISRFSDLFNSLVGSASIEEMHSREPFMFWIAVVPQIVNLLLVADFVYYFLKARAASIKRAGEVMLSLDNV